MKELIDELKNIKLAIFDLDGVIYRGKTLIPNADKIIKELKKYSIKVVYNSNNSTITREMYVERLNSFKIPSKIADFYTSASITSAEITKLKKKAIIFIIGEIGLREELEAMGHTVLNSPSKPPASLIPYNTLRESKSTTKLIATKTTNNTNHFFVFSFFTIILIGKEGL